MIFNIHMAEFISCPKCNYPNNPQNRECENCGINLAIAAVLAENQAVQVSHQPETIPVAPEILVPRLGDYLVEKGEVSKEDLHKALEYQRKQAEAGSPTLIGQALVALDMVDPRSLDQAVTEQIVALQKALEESNQQLEQRVHERTAELQDALKRLTDLNTLKTNFVSNISHELRTPLAHIIGYTDLLKEEALGPLTSDQNNAMNVMSRASARLHNLIDNLIQFSLISQGELSINAQPLEVDQLIHSTVSRFQNAAQEQGVTLTSKISAEALKVKADPEKITWALEQLVDNAIKFNQEEGKVHLGVENQDGMVNFTVADNGIGIDKEKIAEIFEPFHQLDGSATRHYGGTGIGLSLAQQILDAHGSQLKVNSKIGEGSIFEFSLPEA
jgi:signal transduction histidine kinase